MKQQRFNLAHEAAMVGERARVARTSRRRRVGASPTQPVLLAMVRPIPCRDTASAETRTSSATACVTAARNASSDNSSSCGGHAPYARCGQAVRETHREHGTRNHQLSSSLSSLSRSWWHPTGGVPGWACGHARQPRHLPSLEEGPGVEGEGGGLGLPSAPR